MFPTIFPPNSCIYPANGEDFYVSYNGSDIAIYGCKTTALVLGQMAHFFTLNGNHLDEYSKIINQGFDVCMRYFLDHIEAINRNSETPPKFTAGEHVLVVYEGRIQPTRVTSLATSYKPNLYHYRLEIDNGCSNWSEDMLNSTLW